MEEGPFEKKKKNLSAGTWGGGLLRAPQEKLLLLFYFNYVGLRFRFPFCCQIVRLVYPVLGSINDK